MTLCSYDAIIIGSGVIGASVARAIGYMGRSVLLVDALLDHHSSVPSSMSLSSSGVVHSGIGYRTGSMKADLAVKGSWLMRKYCLLRKVHMRQTGKLVVGWTPDQVRNLEFDYRRALDNGAKSIRMISGDDARKLEPSLSSGIRTALWSPFTVTVDVGSYLQSLLGDAESTGNVTIKKATTVTDITLDSNDCRRYVLGLRLDDSGETRGGRRDAVSTPAIINAAGLGSFQVANLWSKGCNAVDSAASSLQDLTSYYKGNYFRVCSRVPFQRLIYPARDSTTGEGHLGVHLTHTPRGEWLLGPDNELLGRAADIESSVYDMVDTSGRDMGDLAERFAKSTIPWWGYEPISARNLTFSHTGVRPRVDGSEIIGGDFQISHDPWRNYIGLHCFGSPGLTASLPLGLKIAKLVTGWKGPAPDGLCEYQSDQGLDVNAPSIYRE